LAHELVKQGVGPAFVCLNDPESVQAAEAIGVGGRGELSIGGKVDDLHGPPLTAEFEVLSLHDGVFEESEVRHGGIKRFDQGRTAIVKSNGLTAMLTSLRAPPFSLRQLTAFGVEPADYQVLVAKGVNAPLAAYAPVSSELIRVDTPGVCTANVDFLKFENRLKPMFPFEKETTWSP